MTIIATDHVSGPAKGVFQLIENIPEGKAYFSLYNFQVNRNLPNKFIAEADKKGLKLHLLNQRGRLYISLIFQAIKEVRENGFHIVQTHGFKPSVIGFFLQMFCGVKWICFLHGTTSENIKVRFYNWVDNVVQQFAARTIIVTEAQRKNLYNGKDSPRVCVLHNAVNLKNPVPVSLFRQNTYQLFSIPTESKLVVVIGRLSPEKGVDVFIHALSILKDMGKKNIHAVLVGDGQERDNLENLAKSLGIVGNIHFTGFTQTPGDYILDADLVVVPSRTEGIPNVVLEAMALGKPVVATAVGGVPEIIEDGKNGILVPPERPIAMAEAIEALIEDEKCCLDIIENGKIRMKEAFSVDARINKLLLIYSEVLSEHH